MLCYYVSVNGEAVVAVGQVTGGRTGVKAGTMCGTLTWEAGGMSDVQILSFVLDLRSGEESPAEVLPGWVMILRIRLSRSS